MPETAQQADRRRQAQAVLRREEEMVNLHVESFPVARPPKANPAEPVDVDVVRERIATDAGLPALERELEPYGAPPAAPAAESVDHAGVIADHRKRLLREVPLIRLAERRKAKQEALATAQAEIAAEEQKRATAVVAEQSRLDRLWADVLSLRSEVDRNTAEAVEREQAKRAESELAEQEQLDREWARLVENDPKVVQQRLSAALSGWARDRVGEVVMVTVDGNEALIIMLVDYPERIVPAERADFTAGGRPTVKKRNQTDRNQLYFATLASGVLGLARYGFAAAPALEHLSVFALRQEAQGRNAGDLVGIYFGRFRRDDPLLDSRDAAWAAEQATDARLNISGRADKVEALDLVAEPHLQRALDRARTALGIAAR